MKAPRNESRASSMIPKLTPPRLLLMTAQGLEAKEINVDDLKTEFN